MNVYVFLHSEWNEIVLHPNRYFCVLMDDIPHGVLPSQVGITPYIPFNAGFGVVCSRVLSFLEQRHVTELQEKLNQANARITELQNKLQELTNRAVTTDGAYALQSSKKGFLQDDGAAKFVAHPPLPAQNPNWWTTGHWEVMRFIKLPFN